MASLLVYTAESSSSLPMPPELHDQLFVCSVEQSQNGPFQDSAYSITARDVIEFSREFLRYRVEPLMITCPLLSQQLEMRFLFS